MDELQLLEYTITSQHVHAAAAGQSGRRHPPRNTVGSVCLSVCLAHPPRRQTSSGPFVFVLFQSTKKKGRKKKKSMQRSGREEVSEESVSGVDGERHPACTVQTAARKRGLLHGSNDSLPGSDHSGAWSRKGDANSLTRSCHLFLQRCSLLMQSLLFILGGCFFFFSPLAIASLPTPPSLPSPPPPHPC